MNNRIDQTLGDLVASIQASARVFDQVGLDYCCRGRRTLVEACAAAGLDAATLAAEIDALDPGTGVDWPSLPADALADHIVATHHAYLREELPLLSALAAKVERVHGARHPELAEVRGLVDELRADLEPHLDKEVRVLFPAIRAVIDGDRREFPFGSLANPIRMMTMEHDRAGELLAALRSATGGYETPSDGCTSYRSLYDRLAALEHDTHVHVHKENHVLFPAALHEWERVAGTSTQQVAIW
jgi:regulator of cell morphogenesis and NO signaling